MKTMLKLMEKESDEYKCLVNALRRVEEVADFINEMQRISETYTPVFQLLCKRFSEIEVCKSSVFFNSCTVESPSTLNCLLSNLPTYYTPIHWLRFWMQLNDMLGKINLFIQ